MVNSRNLRKLHRLIAPIIFLPLFLTAATGVIYRVGRTWFGASSEFGEIMMYIHQGTFLGSQLRVFYVLLNGLGVIAMLFTGIYLTTLFRRKRRSDIAES
jgi:hypothetical protein